ncbi:hypothetical protein QJS10_CPA16g01122 [Acorus calamus]|uniref:Uncharacterized protein n=1 Tax=Acorus calamus TaxID=4465 RepID=A0AAV9CYA8_ACOCL|nr:hypothetical protein QJS10_CPA16g01122 [Acorus calamus]
MSPEDRLVPAMVVVLLRGVLEDLELMSPYINERLGISMDACGSLLGHVAVTHRLKKVEGLLEYEMDPQYDDDGAMKKDALLFQALSQLSSEFSKESMLSLHRFASSRYASVIPTGSLKLDLALGIGGLPKGRMIEIYGKEASGKTTLALHVIKEAQKLGGYCAYLDVENAMDPSLAEAMDIFDSRKHGHAWRGPVPVSDTDTVGTGHGHMSDMPPTVSAEMGYIFAVRLRIARKALIRDEDEAIGINVSVQVMKNKLGPALKKAELDIKYGCGIRRESEVFEMACEHGIILKNDGYWIQGEFFEDKVEAEHYLAQNGVVLRILSKRVDGVKSRPERRRVVHQRSNGFTAANHALMRAMYGMCRRGVREREERSMG